MSLEGIIHNFDLKRADGTTAAQRLSDYMGELPVVRGSFKAQQVSVTPPRPS